MISKEDYNIFNSKLLSIIDDTVETNPNENDLKQNLYFVKKGLWEGTEEQFYVYNKSKLPPHKDTLLSLCKNLPKFQAPSEKHGGLISAFDLLMDSRKYPELTPEDTYYQILMANHFSNLLEATNIAQICETNSHGHKTFFIAIFPRYREYMEKNGQEPADN